MSRNFEVVAASYKELEIGHSAIAKLTDKTTGSDIIIHNLLLSSCKIKLELVKRQIEYGRNN